MASTSRSIVAVHNSAREELLNTSLDFLEDPNCVEKRITNKENGFYAFIPARHFLSFMVFWALFLVYSLRVNLSVAIVAMVKQRNSSDTPINNECPASNQSTYNLNNVYEETGEFDWDERTKGMVLGAFFYGYVVTQIPGGRLAELFGGKWLLGGGVLCTSIFTLILPFAARWNFYALMVSRVFAGIGEGVTYPAYYAIFSKWIPKDEYSLQLAISGCGAQIGTVVTLPIAAILCDVKYDGGWPLVFYVFGALGCFWFILWTIFVTNTPEDHPRITLKELRHIQENRQTSIRQQRNALPWKMILTSIPLWALSVEKFCNSWVFYTVLTELPNYMQTILHFNINQNAWQNSIIYLVQAIIGVIAGVSADYIRSLNYFSVTTIRKSFQLIACLGTGVCIASVTLVGCEKLSIFLLLVASMALMGFSAGGENPITLDMAPNYAGTVFGISNTISNMAGIFAPMVTGLIINNNDTMAGWGQVFYISALFEVIGALIFLLFISAEPLPWAVSPQYVLLETEENLNNPTISGVINNDPEEDSVS